MSDKPPVTVIFSGAGGGVVDPRFFCSSVGQRSQFPTIRYPGWRRYVERDFSAEKLIEELASQVAARVPKGAIRIIGLSIGGHVGYAVALRLQASGRRIGGFCAIDTFTATSASPMAGWKMRALQTGAAMLRDQRLGEFIQFLRSRFWRASLRLSGESLVDLVRRLAPSGRLPWVLRVDPIFEEELSMRLLIRELAPWVASLDRDPAPISAPTVLLRTPSTGDADFVWWRRCPGIKVVEISGDHHTLFSACLREFFVTASSNWS